MIKGLFGRAKSTAMAEIYSPDNVFQKPLEVSLPHYPRFLFAISCVARVC